MFQSCFREFCLCTDLELDLRFVRFCYVMSVFIIELQSDLYYLQNSIIYSL